MGDGRKLAQVGAAGTAAVGSYARTRSPYGCEDLVGNVSEWYAPVPDGTPVGHFPPADLALPAPQPGVPAYAVVRGACFLRSGRKAVRSIYRRRLSVTRRNRWTGFRVASLLPVYPVTARLSGGGVRMSQPLRGAGHETSIAVTSSVTSGFRR